MRSHSRAHASYWTDTLTYVTRDEVENKETRCLFSLASRLLNYVFNVYHSCQDFSKYGCPIMGGM